MRGCKGSRTRSGYDAGFNWKRSAETQVRVLGLQWVMIKMRGSSPSENKRQRCDSGDACKWEPRKSNPSTVADAGLDRSCGVHGCLRHEALIKPARFEARVAEGMMRLTLDLTNITDDRGVSGSLRWINLPHIFGSGCSRTSPWSPTVKSCCR